jgi:ectoine hydroxylase-related dioxygenase (phytanoyl-CoA dioxygenase family)
MSSMTMRGLTPAQVSQFHEQGYLVVERLLPPATIAAVRAELHEVVDRAIRQLHAEGRLADVHADADFDHQLARIARHDLALAGEVIARVHGRAGEGGHIGPAMFDLMTAPPLLDAMASLLGPELVGSSVYRIRPKAPGLAKGAVPWHQDSGYLLGHCDGELIVTCWIPLVDATVANGCLYVLPRTHRQGILRHYTGGPSGYLVIADEDLPPGQQPIPVPVPQGGALLLTNLTPHASFVNQSDHMRWSVDLRYQGAGVPHNVFKTRAELRAELPDTELACYPPEKDFVVRSQLHPERVVRDWRELKRLRDSYLDSGPVTWPRPGRWSRLPA